MENIQEKNERRVQQGKKQHPQRLNGNSLLVQMLCRQIGGVADDIYKRWMLEERRNEQYDARIYDVELVKKESRGVMFGSSPINEFVP